MLSLIACIAAWSTCYTPQCFAAQPENDNKLISAIQNNDSENAERHQLPAQIRKNTLHQHHHMENEDVVQITNATYSIPDVYLTRMDGKRIKFLSLVSDEPVILNFIFTTCSAICPTLTATFSQVQEKLDAEHLSVPQISISIDPEEDTPGSLRRYARKYSAGPNWNFFTGDKVSIISLQKAFNAYRGNKMNHIPLTFIKTDSNQWVRIDGFASASDIIKQYKKIRDK